MSETVSVQHLTAPDELFRWFGSESEPQGAFIELGIEDGILRADYDGIIGNGSPGSVHHGIDRRYGIPVLTMDAANKLLDELAPLAQRILNDSEVEWNGRNWVGVLGKDAQDAEDAIEARLGLDYRGADAVFDESDKLPVWTTESMGEVWDADDAGITAATTDEELTAIEAKLLAEFREGMDQPDAIIHGLDQHLKGLRDELAAEQD